MCRLCQNVDTLCCFRQAWSVQHICTEPEVLLETYMVLKWEMKTRQNTSGFLQNACNRIPTRCNWNSFLGKLWTLMELSQYLKASIFGFPNMNLCSPSLSPSSMCVWFHWTGREGKAQAGVTGRRLSSPPGEVGGYGFECCQTVEEIDTLLQFDNALECLLKSVYWEHLSCRTDALWCYLESYPLIV